MSEKIFRHSPHRAADSLKIIVGNKTNATIRDLEETEEDIQELEGTVTSIDKDKITGNGWEVETEEGKYQCSLASNMYELPETEEYGGMYYPTDTVSVKIEVNPVLRTNKIVEITSLGENEESLDLSKWKHGDKATTIIGKPKSAISVSDAFISFNYDNDNSVLADTESVKTNGKKTTINTKKLEVNSGNVMWQSKDFYDMLNDELNKALGNNTKAEQISTKGVDILKQESMGQLNIKHQIFIPSSERLVADLIDPSIFPEFEQRHPLLSGSNIDELYIYPNGLVTIRGRSDVERERDVFSTINWIAPQYIRKNILQTTVTQMCSCCSTDISGQQEYFNYCPHCRTWNTLTNKNGHIVCNSCSNIWCEGCGHLISNSCEYTERDLKPYSEFNIKGLGTFCNYCQRSYR